MTDGFYSAICHIDIQLFPFQSFDTFKFLTDIHRATIKENIKGPVELTLLNPIGYNIGEQLEFHLLNLQEYFTISERTGSIGIKENVIFDREIQAYYLVQVEVNIIGKVTSVTRTTVNVTIEDENDNFPMFKQSKYYRAVNIEVKALKELLQVIATDDDSGENSNIT